MRNSRSTRRGSQGTASFLAGPRMVHLIVSFGAMCLTHLPLRRHSPPVSMTGGAIRDIDPRAQLRRQPGLRLELNEPDGQYWQSPLQSPAQAVQRCSYPTPGARLCETGNVHEVGSRCATGALQNERRSVLRPVHRWRTRPALQALIARTDFGAVKKELATAGYDGETVVFVGLFTVPAFHAQAQVAVDLSSSHGVHRRLSRAGPGRDRAASQQQGAAGKRWLECDCQLAPTICKASSRRQIP